MNYTLGALAWVVAALAGGAVLLLCLRAWRRARSARRLISLVLLLREARQLEAPALAEAASRALGIKVTAGEEPNATDFVVGESPQFMLQAQGRMFLVLNVPRPYTDDPAADAERIPDLRLRKAFALHKAWLSVDLVGEAATAEERDAAYRTIGRLIAALAADDGLALFTPATGHMNTLGAELLERLRSGDPLEDLARLEHPPVVPVAADDPRMQAAVAEARRRWPEFVAAFGQRRPEQHFSIKAPVSDGEHTEFIWIDVTGIEGDTIRGTLSNAPVGLGALRLGDPVEVGVADLNDWVYGDSRGIEGGFTVSVLADAAKKGR